MNWPAIAEYTVLGVTGGFVGALVTQVFARLTIHNRPMQCEDVWPDAELMQVNTGEALVHRCGFSSGHGGHLHVCTCGASKLVNEAARQHGKEA